MKLLRLAFLLPVLIIISSCGSNFMVYKKGTHFYVSSTGPELRRILCDSGDMKSIAMDSGLPEGLQKELFDGICGSNKVKERLMSTLEGMTKDQRTDLKISFQKHGYEINNVANC